jgi:thioredoxin 1
MLDRMKLLNRLRRIWFRKSSITPGMVVDTMKALYEFITGRPALCLALVFFICAPTVAAEYKLAGPGKTRYGLSTRQKTERPARSIAGSSKQKADKVIVVSATWCQPCKRMYPIIERLKMDGYDAEVVYDYDGPSVITAYPTILFLKDGKVLYKNVGVTSERTLRFNLESPDAP